MIQQKMVLHTAQFMLDLETFGLDSNAMIVSIGVCKIDFLNRTVGRKFYRNINPESYKGLDYSIEPSVVKWWMGRSEEAREQLINPTEAISIRQALAELTSFLLSTAAGDPIVVWGNGVDFDNAIIAHHYKQTGIKQPWTFRENRCYRTVKNIFRDGPFPVDSEISHHALQDAIWQASHLILINNRHNLGL